MIRKNALRALKNLCAFIGAIVLFSYFYNWAVDLRHWYVTLASAITCSILWLGFYVIEMHGGITRVASWLSHIRNTLTKLQAPPAEPPELPADPPGARSHTAEDEMKASNPLPWLNPQRIK